MDKYSLFVPNFLPAGEYVHPKKNETCVGCGVSVAVRQIGKVIENLVDDVTFERSGAEIASLQVKKGNSEVVFCLDDEPDGSIDGVVKKNRPKEAVSEGVAYVATASPSYPFDFVEKIKKALKVEGKSYIHVLCPCPSSWQFDTQNTVKVGFKAVESLAFPLYEVEGGSYKLTNKTIKPRALADYLGAQKRFSGVKEKEVEAASALVQEEYKKLFGAA